MLPFSAAQEITTEIRYAFRRLRRSAGFSTVAILLLALGIGTSTTIFTVTNVVLFRPLPVRRAQSLVQLFERYPNIRPQSYLPYALYEDIRDHSSTLSDVIGRLEMSTVLEGNADPERVNVDLVTDGFLSALGPKMAVGRIFGPEDDHVAVLSYDAWTRFFARDRFVPGIVVRLAGHTYQIVGVTSAGFNGISAELSPDLFVPFRNLNDFLNDSNNNQNLQHTEIAGFLRNGVSREQAAQEIEALWRRSRIPFGPPDSDAERQVKLEVKSIEFGASSIRDQYATQLLLVLVGASLLVLMLSANVGGLFVTRAAAQEKEIAVRLALGAGRLQTTFHWLFESILLTVAGAVGGALMTFVAIPLVTRWLPLVPEGADPGDLRSLSLHIRPDARVLACFLAICAVTAILTSIAPAMRSGRRDLYFMLKTGIGEKRHRRLQSMLCALQVGFCTVLLVSAVLTYRTLYNLRKTDPGLDSNHVVSFSVDPGMRHYDAERAWSFQQRLLADARALPQVRAAGLGGMPLMRGIGVVTVLRVPGRDAPGGGFNTSMNVVSAGYFDAVGIQLLSGRDFQERDSDVMPGAIVVNEAFAHRFFGNDDVIGRFVGVTKDNRPQYQIVGLVSDAHYRSMREIPPPVFYQPFHVRQAANRFILEIRTNGRPESLIQPIRELVRSIDPAMPVYQAATFEEEIDRSLWQERLTASLAAGFASLAMILSAIGLYGMLAYFVIQHQREIGVRMAIGAGMPAILYLVSRKIVVSLLGGIVGGAILFAIAAKSLQIVLYGVDVFDPTSITQAVMLLMAVGLVAMIIPGLRAIRIDPASSLREE